MAEIRERRTVIHDIPVERRPVVENQHEHIVHERRGMSGAEVAAIVIAAVIAAVLITALIINNQRQSREDELAIERERAAAAERSAAQSPPQQPPQVVVVPQQPSTVPLPVPPPSQPAPAAGSPASSTSNLSVEIEVNSKLLDDPELRTHPITVRFENGAATLSGSVPSEALKMKAEKVALTVKGVRRVINNITVQQ